MRRLHAALSAIFLTFALSAQEQSPLLPFDKPSSESLRASKRLVFAHHHIFPPTWNQDSWRDYYSRVWLNPLGKEGKKDYSAWGGFIRQKPLPCAVSADPDWRAKADEDDVRLAKAMGLDGFIVNLVAGVGSSRWKDAERLIEAAQRVDPEFKIIVGGDCVCAFASEDPALFVDLMKELAKHPNVMRYDGKIVMSAWGAQNHDSKFWAEVLRRLKADGIEVSFIPCAHGHWAKGKDGLSWLASNSSQIDGLMDSAVNSVYSDKPSESLASGVHKLTGLWVDTARAQDVRTGVSWDSGNSRLFRKCWEQAIRRSKDSDWMQIFTWNDYKESAMRPSTGIQWSFYDLASFYISWFKTGVQPQISRDILYCFYRTQTLKAKPDLTKQEKPFKINGGPFDEIELLAFLAKPGTLEIEIAGQPHRMDAPAGMTSFRIPSQEGTPVFRLLRDGKAQIAMRGKWTVSDSIVYQNHLYHGGSSSRERDLTKQPALEALRQDLALELRFNEVWGPMSYDSSGNARNGAFSDFSALSHGSGIDGQALYFPSPAKPGKTLDISSPIDLSGGSFSVALWVFPLQSFSGSLLELSGQGGRFALDSADGRLRFSFSNGGAPSSVVSAKPLPAGKWTLAAASFNGKELRLFENAQLQGSKSLEAAIPLEASYKATLGSGYAGAIDELSIFKRTLPEALQRRIMEAAQDPALDSTRLKPEFSF